MAIKRGGERKETVSAREKVKQITYKKVKRVASAFIYNYSIKKEYLLPKYHDIVIML